MPAIRRESRGPGEAAPREGRRGTPAGELRPGEREKGEIALETHTPHARARTHTHSLTYTHTQTHTSPRAEAGLGAQEAGRGGTEEPEGGTDGRDHGRAGGVEKGGWEGPGTGVETAPLHPNHATVASTAGGSLPGARAGSPAPRALRPPTSSRRSEKAEPLPSSRRRSGFPSEHRPPTSHTLLIIGGARGPQF